MYIYNKKQVEQVVAVFSDVYDELAGRFIEKNEYSDESFAGYLYEHINDVLVFSNLEKFLSIESRNEVIFQKQPTSKMKIFWELEFS